VGKSSVGAEIHAQLSTAAIPHCLIDGDFLDMAYPVPWEHGLAERNLAAVWSNYRDLGQRRLIYTNTASVLAVEMRRLTAAMGDDPEVIAVLLTCTDETACERLSRREVGSTVDEHLRRSDDMAKLLEADAPRWVHRVDTDNRSVPDIAAHVIGLTGWLGGGTAQLRMAIRVCATDDLPALQAAFGSSAFHSERLQAQHDGTSSYLIAWHDGTPVGHLNLRWEVNTENEVQERLPNTPELNALNVWPPTLRSRGIGRRLIETAEQMAKTRGYNRVALGVEVTNARARRLYEQLGYRDWGHGTYVDRWAENDEQGHETLHQDRCNYLVKRFE
jgi:GNAT superfamily N-acetyltransferase